MSKNSTDRDDSIEHGTISLDEAAAQLKQLESSLDEVQAEQANRAIVERQERTLVALGGVLTRDDLLEALEGLADRIRNVQQFERRPRHQESAPSDLTCAEEVLRALHFALLRRDADLVDQLHRPAVAAMRDPLRDDPALDAAAIRTGAAVRKVRDFGKELLDLLGKLDAVPEAEVAARIASAPIWRDCPLTCSSPRALAEGLDRQTAALGGQPRSLRSLNGEHPFLMPYIESWVLTEWQLRRQGVDAENPDYLALSRGLLRALGVNGQDAANAFKGVS